MMSLRQPKLRYVKLILQKLNGATSLPVTYSFSKILNRLVLLAHYRFKGTLQRNLVEIYTETNKIMELSFFLQII